MKLLRQTYPGLLKTFDQVRNLINSVYTDVGNVVNGQLTLSDNMRGSIFTATTPSTPDTEFFITHGFNRNPIGFLVLSVDQAAIIYKGATAWNLTTISLKCNQASVNIVIFVM